MIHKIRVYPNSSENKIEKAENILKIYVKEKPENNKANLAVLKLLSRYFNINVKNIKIKNQKSRNKIIEIKDK